MKTRPIIALAAAIAICAIAAVLTLAWLGSTRTEVPVFAEQYAALVESYQRDAAMAGGAAGAPLGENRWDLMVQLLAMHEGAMTAIQALPAEHAVDFDIIGIGAKGTPEARENTLAALRDLEEAGLLELLDQFAKAQRFVRPPQNDYAFNWLLPELGVARWTIRACGARLKLAMEADDAQEAARAFEHIMALSRAVSHDPVIISHLVADAIGLRGLEMLRDLLMARQLEAHEIRLFQKALARQTPRMPLLLALEGEALIQLDSIRMIYDNPDMSPSQALLTLQGGAGRASRIRAAIEARGRLGSIPSREQAIASSRHINDKILAAARKPSHEIEPAMREVQAELHQLPRALLVLMPSLDRITSAHLQYKAMVAGMQLMLALELHRAKQGAYPDTLDDLVPDYLHALPRDPFSSKAFIYRPFAEGDDLRGRAYILYSVGRDGIDNGGRLHEDGAGAAARGRGDGFDFVINEP